MVIMNFNKIFKIFNGKGYKILNFKIIYSFIKLSIKDINDCTKERGWRRYTLNNKKQQIKIMYKKGFCVIELWWLNCSYNLIKQSHFYENKQNSIIG